MCVRKDTPCNWGECPFSAEYSHDCEYWCGADEPQDDPTLWEDSSDEE